MYNVILTQCKKVRWEQVVTKSKHWLSFPLEPLLYEAATLKSVGEGHQIEPKYSNIFAFSNMPEGQNKSPVRYI